MPQCPECGGKLKRVHRKLGDRVKSVFAPVNRYKCRSYDCEWEGTLRSPSRSQKTAKTYKSILLWTLLIIIALIIGRVIVR